ncbi:hypothetical protein Q8F55_002640 [Vanrija albida]|uniref:FAD-binding domain-containing protein n=1 Tax=Vanrija albida TaxID=181172 RepID=A0ABR3QAD7_9TREE
MTVSLSDAAPSDAGAAAAATPLRIAAAILALSKLPNARVTAFEKAPGPREAGAWISLNPSGLEVLAHLLPLSEITDIVFRPTEAGDYNHRHWATGALLHSWKTSPHIRPEFAAARTARPPLHAALVRHYPPDTVHYSRRVTGVSIQPDGRAALSFEDAPAEPDFDLVVAADGIYSPLRRQYWPDHDVGYKGAVAYRTVFPRARLDAIAHLLPPDSSAWRGPDGGIVFLSELGLGTFGVVVIRREDAAVASSLRWEGDIGPEALQVLRGHYAAWDPVVGEVLALVDSIQAYPLDSGPWLQHLTRDGRVAFIGDAAHPTAGAFGAGAGMGYGDAWALYLALVGTAANGAEYNVRAALQVFERARLPFLLRVERQFAVDAANAKYVAAVRGDDAEWVRRFKARNVSVQWLVEHSVELEVQKVLAEEAWVD